MNVETVLAAIRELISTSSTAGGDGGGATSGLTQRLQANLSSYQELIHSDTKYQDVRCRVLHYKDAYQLTTTTGCTHLSLSATPPQTPQDTYIEFIPESLSLLLVLNEVLCTLHEEDKRLPVSQAAGGGRAVAPQAPKSLLSISDQKTVQTLAQFIVSLGIFPYLIPPLDVLLRMRLSHAKMVDKCEETISSEEKATHLYKSCRVIVKCFENPVLGPTFISQHLSDVLVTLLQICYSPQAQSEATEKKKIDSSDRAEVERHSSPGDVTVRESEKDKKSVKETKSTFIGVSEREWCEDALHKLLNKTYQPLVVRELLAIQKISSFGSSKMGGSARWLQRVCGLLLSERLLHKNGVQHVLRGIFEATVTVGGSAEDSSADWKKCQAVAKIISSCPAGVSTVEDYYSIICPQVLGLLRLPKDGIGRQFLRVAVATVSAMMSKQRQLGMRYLFRPLIRPLLQLTGEESVSRRGDLSELCDPLEQCMEDLHRICTIIEPSSLFLNSTLPYLPLIFDLWRITKPSNSDFSSRCREVMVRVLKPVSMTTVVTFLGFISGIKDKDCNKLNFKELHPDLLLTCTKEANFKLTLETQSDIKTLQGLDTDKMESVGNCVLDLVECDFKSGPVPGLLFIKCLDHLSRQLCETTGYTPPSLSPGLTSDTPPPQQASTSIPSDAVVGVDKYSSQPTSSGLLLEYEKADHGSVSHTQAYHTALVLYVAAALCEHMSNELLKSVSELPHLLQAISVIVLCHAYFVSPEKAAASSGGSRGQSLLLVGGGPPDLDELPGSSISLSIVFGLLSAILGGGVDLEIERKDRPLLNSLLSPLETIASRYPDPEMASLAGDLRVCVATLGAVWSEEMREKAEEMKSEGSFTKKVKLAANLPQKGKIGEKDRTTLTTKPKGTTEFHNGSDHSLTETKSSESCSLKEAVLTDSTKEKLDDVKLSKGESSSKDSFQQALRDMADPLVPVQGHGLISLTRLIAAKDKETLSNADQLLPLLKQRLNHPDTYIYLSAINGLAALASSCSTHRDKVVAMLCQEYAALSGPPSREAATRVDKETGQLKSTASAALKDDSLKESGVREQRSLELRMKLGETLVRVARETNELLPRYMEQMMASILSNVRDPDPLVRASSLSNLADVVGLARFSLAPFQNEILSCVRHILETDREVKVRQAALTVLKLLIKGLSQDAIQVLGDSLLEVYRLLKLVEGSEREELTRAHAQAALGELDSVMRKFLFPEPNLRPQKKITILN